MRSISFTAINSRILGLKGNDLAPVEGLYTETHDHRQACARTSLAASQRSALVVQEIYTWGGGLAFLRMGVRRRPCQSFTMLTSRDLNPGVPP